MSQVVPELSISPEEIKAVYRVGEVAVVELIEGLVHKHLKW
ncbi:MAG: hypothetical protein WBA76_16030 [Phormidesmis sp.]